MKELIKLGKYEYPPKGVYLRRDRPIYKYGDLYVGVVNGFRAFEYVTWKACTAEGKTVATERTRKWLMLALKKMEETND